MNYDLLDKKEKLKFLKFIEEFYKLRKQINIKLKVNAANLYFQLMGQER